MPMRIPLPARGLLAALAAAGAALAQPACTVSIQQYADLGGAHVDECTPLHPQHYPPTSGPHFPVWADPGVYHAVINTGYWLHSAEHGAVVFLINCHRDADCEADFGRLQAIADAYPADPACGNGEKHRIIITGDTLITTKFAAVAWNWSLGSDCLDSAAFAGFLKAHYAQGPEDICGSSGVFKAAGGCNAPLALAAPRPPARRAGGEARTWRAALWPGLPDHVRPDGKTLLP
jgi:hypothetical protein